MATIFGDSHTRGYDGTSTFGADSYDGFRARLDQDLALASITPSWLGSQSCATASYARTRLHEGVNGDTWQLKMPGSGGTSTVDTVFGVGKPLAAAVCTIVNLGTNGGLDSDTSTYAPQILRYIWAKTQHPIVLMKLDANSMTTRNALLFNTGGIVDQLRLEGILIYVADVASPPMVHPTDFIGDGIHEAPGAGVGYDKLGHLTSPAVIAAWQGQPLGTY